MPLFIAVLRKIECLVTWLSHVHKVGSHITLRTHITDHIEHSILSSLPYYILLALGEFISDINNTTNMQGPDFICTFKIDS